MNYGMQSMRTNPFAEVGGVHQVSTRSVVAALDSPEEFPGDPRHIRHNAAEDAPLLKHSSRVRHGFAKLIQCQVIHHVTRIDASTTPVGNREAFYDITDSDMGRKALLILRVELPQQRQLLPFKREGRIKIQPFGRSGKSTSVMNVEWFCHDFIIEKPPAMLRKR